MATSSDERRLRAWEATWHEPCRCCGEVTAFAVCIRGSCVPLCFACDHELLLLVRRRPSRLAFVEEALWQRR